jgi:hypothetical protein
MNRPVADLPVRPRHADQAEVVRGVAGQRLAEPGQRLPGVGDDDLEPAGVGAGAFDHHPGGPAFQGLADEVVAVAGLAPDRDVDLAGVEPSAVGGAARNLPVATAEELRLGRSRRRLTEGIPRCGERSTNQRAIGYCLHAASGSEIPGTRHLAAPDVPDASRAVVPPKAAAFFGRGPEKGNARLAPRPMRADRPSMAAEFGPEVGQASRR